MLHTYIYIAILLYLHIFHVPKNSNFHVHKKPSPVPNQNHHVTSSAARGRKWLSSPRHWMVTRWQSLLMDKQEVGCRDVGWMDFHSEICTASLHPGNTWGFLEDEFPFKR